MKRRAYSVGSSVIIPRSTSYRSKKKRGLPDTQLLFENTPKTTAEFISKRDPCSSQWDESGIDETLPNEPILDKKLYTGSRITEDEGVLLIFGFVSKHKLTHAGTKDLLSILKRFVPENCHLPSSYEAIIKKIPKGDPIFTHHFYCSKCTEYLNQKEKICPTSQERFDRPTMYKNGQFFTTFSVKTIIESLLQDVNISKELALNLEERNVGVKNGIVTDIMDGKLYQEMNLKNYEFTCSMNTDGVPIFKSSNCSIWPILISSNELSYRTRSKHSLVAALWFGKAKPDFDVFFHPFVKECATLSEAGVTWNAKGKTISSRVFFPIMVNDSVARCLCQGLHQFNGSFGCTWCLIEGETFTIEGSMCKKRIYKGPLPCQSRTSENFISHLTEFRNLLELNPNIKSYYGIKSASRLLLMPKFNIVSGFTFDYMHTAFLGVSRSFLELWLDSKNHHLPFYIRKRAPEIDDRLLKFSVPYKFDRAIRTLSERKNWKATEWRTWTFVAASVLQDILPHEFLNHFLKFVEGIMLLSKNEVTPLDIERSDLILLEFSSGLEQLYDLSRCSYNCHIMTHASKCVENWGPLWAYSAFQYENHNGVLLRLINGTKKIGVEISNKIFGIHSALNWSRKLVKTDAIQIFQSMCHNIRTFPSGISISGIHFYGHRKLYYLNLEDKMSLQNIGVDFTGNHCFSYEKSVINGVLYSTLNERSSRKCNYIAHINGYFYIIEKILAISPHPVCIVRKINVKRSKENLLLYSVTRHAKRTCFQSLRDCKYKFLCSRNGKTVEQLIQLPNSIENE